MLLVTMEEIRQLNLKEAGPAWGYRKSKWEYMDTIVTSLDTVVDKVITK